MTMILRLQRIKDNGMSTTGKLDFSFNSCYTMEDTGRDLNKDGDLDDPGEKKVYSKTRIPAGVYRILFRTEGRMHEKYLAKFDFHRGMLELQNVKGFKYILIHIGNTAKDSAGCILVGDKIHNDNFISGSTNAYKKLYPIVADALDRDETVLIEINDED